MYLADDKRYDNMQYRRTGKSGLLLPEVSLGLWHNFGGVDVMENCRAMLHRAFDRGVTHFDLANNYGPPPGSAEETFGHIFTQDFKTYRDELILSTKAGYGMWPGPYGDWGSKKYLTASLDQSLKRMQVDYVDIFYSHREDPNTPLEETVQALDLAVRQGKALYVGISNYSPEKTKEAIELFKAYKTPFIIHQVRYSMLDRKPEAALLDVLGQEGKGCIVFSPLAQGLLTNKYLKGIPEQSRAAKATGFLQTSTITPGLVNQLQKLNELATARGQSLAQMALAWLLRHDTVTSVLIGTSSVQQLDNSLDALNNKNFTSGELQAIEEILAWSVA